MTTRSRLGAAGLLLAALSTLLVSPPAVASSSGFSATRTISRTNLVNGSDQVVDTRTFSLEVDRTSGLRDRDGLAVSWSGAHPSANLPGDVNSTQGLDEEYPVVLLQCRGKDSASVPLAQQISPQTCFTQSPLERYVRDGSTSLPPWRLDRYASLADRGAKVGLPSPVPAPPVCPFVGSTIIEHNLPFVTAAGTSFPVGNRGCAGVPPEMSIQSTTGLPDNLTFGITDADGTGTARFDVRAAEDNASLGCSTSVPCALVAVPVMGISCDVGGSQLPADERVGDPDAAAYADKQCMAAGAVPTGTFYTSPFQDDVSVSGSLWWSASNWRNRVVVPLSFATSPSVCDVTGSQAPLYFYGSELLVQASTQWAPKFCLDPKSFAFKHVQTGEPQAANLLTTRSVDAAFVSRIPTGGWGSPTATAPIGITSFVIAFAVDGKDRSPVTQLRLTPRLLAKLLTESYPVIPVVRDNDAALHGNPINISADPEFIALNPGIKVPVNASEAASTLLALSSDSDVIHALTAYIDADPEARAFLDGVPDPWGMTVNPSYRGIELPVDNWPLLDTFIPKPAPNECMDEDPTPYLPLVAAPTQRLAAIGIDMQYSLSPSQTDCYLSPAGKTGNKLVALGRQAGGFRFMLGIMGLADAERYGVRQAELLTHTSPGAEAKFTDATGRAFVGPDDASMRAAAALRTADAKAGTWTIDPQVLRSSSAGAGAYPGTMPLYAAIPTQGLGPTEANHYASWLRFAVGPGQSRGSGVGQLPPGYLPLTSANGLGDLAAYTDRAASSVAAQDGTVPGLTASAPPPATPAPTPTSGVPAAPSSVPTLAPVPGTGSVVPVTSLPPVVPQPRTSAPVIAVAAGVTTGATLGPLSALLPALLGLGLLSGTASVVLSGARPRRRRRA
jgi:hypothetical protein